MPPLATAAPQALPEVVVPQVRPPRHRRPVGPVPTGPPPLVDAPVGQAPAEALRGPEPAPPFRVPLPVAVVLLVDEPVVAVVILVANGPRPVVVTDVGP